jgi:hypothetical protein
MKIANTDRLIHHFESCVDVKLFTIPEIVTIVKSFSVEIPEGTQIFEKQRPGIDNKLLSEEQRKEETT